MSRNYSSTAAEASLAAAVTGSSTLLQVSSVSGFPSVPFTLIVDPDTVSEEIVTVTGVAGATLTVTRGEDGTSGVSHEVGAGVRHGVSARDLREPQQHIAASTGVHGVGAGSSVVGTGTSQTLSNKVLDSSCDVVADALPSDTVFASGAQTVSDKTFDTSNTYNVPTPTASSHAASKDYVDGYTSSGSFGSSESGWSTIDTARDSQLIRDKKRRTLFLAQKRTSSSTISSTSSGNIGNVNSFRLASSSDWPTTDVPTGFKYTTAAGADLGGTATIRADGYVELNSLLPSSDIRQDTSSGGWSIQVHASWYVA